MEVIKTKIGRRSFLKISAAAGGGFLVGFNWLLSSKILDVKKSQNIIPKEWFTINGYIRINESGQVTILSPNPEIGQNVMTSMPMIVAEELDVSWDQVVVEQGKLDEDAFKNPQFAGGSLSIMRGWDPLRIAGAAGRYMLMKAASNNWGVSIDQLTTKEGSVYNKLNKKKLGYGELASKAVNIEVPKSLKLKKPEDYKIIGTSKKNVIGPKIIRGENLFGIDFKKDNMKLAMIEHPPSFGLRIKNFNRAEIISLPGVIDAFLIDTSLKNPGWADVNAFNEVIAIVGTETWSLIQAKKKLKIDFETVETLESSDLHEDKLDDALKNGTVNEQRLDGKPKEAFKNASKIIERTYSCPFIAHNTLEPMNFFADVKKKSAKLIGPIQTPKALKNSAANLLNIPKKNIDVLMTRIGGGFGRRLYVHFGLEAALISKKMGSPIKLIYKREDDITQGVFRPAYKSIYKAAFDEKNRLTAFSVRGAGLPNGPIFPNRFPAGAIENYKAENISSYTNISTGAWRAPKSNFTAGAEQAFLDEVAESCKQDPIEFRIELLNRVLDKPIGSNLNYEPKRFVDVLKLVRDKSGWDDKTNKSMGVSSYFCHNTYVAEVIDMELVEDKPKIKNIWCAVDCGIIINKDSAKNMIEGSIIDGIGHAMFSKLNFKDGAVTNNNFDKYNLIRHNQSPSNIKVYFVKSNKSPTGLGEPGLPPSVGALANALYKITGKRFYEQPFFNI